MATVKYVLAKPVGEVSISLTKADAVTLKKICGAATGDVAGPRRVLDSIHSGLTQVGISYDLAQRLQNVVIDCGPDE